MPRLSLVCFGVLQATLDNERLTNFHSVKVQALLAYLALEADRAHHREALATLFWPLDSETSARNSLRQALYELRKMLGDRDDLATPFLLVTRQTVQFNRASDYTLDVADFLAHLKQGQLAEAAVRYPGELLRGLTCESEPFEEWLRQSRAHFHHLAVDINFKLTETALKLGNATQARDYAQRQLTLEPWREEAHRQLMTALALDGERSAALAQYETCRRVLAAELDVAPDAETTALYEQIKAGKLRSPAAPQPPRLVPALPLHNLPAELDLFLGRELELDQIERHLRDPAQRLVTLTGIGGIGKTSLALRIAHRFAQASATAPRFPDGIFFAALGASAPRTESIALPATKIADALGLSGAAAENADATAVETTLANALRQRQLLLVLDDVELSQSNIDLLLLLLQKAPNLVILTTTHAPLHIKGEQLIRLEGLAFPAAGAAPPAAPEEDNDKHAALAAYSAVQLFIRTAQATAADLVLDPVSLQAISRICRLLEGMPLGIQLAASWTRVLSCAEILAEIEQNLDFLSEVMPHSTSRHRSLRAVLDASWRLLTPREQTILSGLSVFRGGFTRESAATVAGATLADLAALVDKSIVKRRMVSQRETSGNPPITGSMATDRQATLPTPAVRYGLLDILRVYAAEQLEQSQQTAPILTRHANYYSNLLATLYPALQGAGQGEALRTIHAELENIRAMCRGLFRQPFVTPLALRQTAASFESLFVFYDIRSWFQEGEAVFRQTADLLAAGDLSNQATLVLYAQLRARQGWFTFHLGRQAESQQLLEESLTQLQQNGAMAATIFNHNYLGAVARHRGDWATAQSHLNDGLQLAQTHGDRFGASVALNNLAQVAAMQGDYGRASELCRQSLAIKRVIGDRRGMMFSLSYLGQLAHFNHEPVEARRRYQESLVIAQELGDRRSMALTLRQLGDMTASLDEIAPAQAFYTQSLQLLREINSGRELCLTLCRVADLALTSSQGAAPPTPPSALYEALQLALTLNDAGCLAEGLLSAIHWQAAQGHVRLALAHLATLQAHPLSTPSMRQRAAQLQAQFAAQAPPDWVASPNLSTISLEALVEASLLDLPDPTPSAG